jgi:hypothetical protein
LQLTRGDAGLTTAGRWGAARRAAATTGGVAEAGGGTSSGAALGLDADEPAATGGALEGVGRSGTLGAALVTAGAMVTVTGSRRVPSAIPMAKSSTAPAPPRTMAATRRIRRRRSTTPKTSPSETAVLGPLRVVDVAFETEDRSPELSDGRGASIPSAGEPVPVCPSGCRPAVGGTSGSGERGSIR